MSDKFWKHYDSAVKPGVAGIADDVRHKLIEEGWYGRQTTGNIADTTTQAPAVEAVDADPIDAFYAQTRASDAKTSDLYGQAPAPSPAIEAPTTDGGGYEPEL